MVDLDPMDVACPRCGAEPGKLCVYTTHRGYRGMAMKFGHQARKDDARVASTAAKVLTGA